MDAGTLELVELDQALDWDHEPHCEAPANDGRVATWLVTLPCCGRVLYSCDRHYLLEQTEGSTTCNFCNGFCPALKWEPIR